MDRRSFLFAALTTPMPGTTSIAAPAPKSRAWFELHFYYLRNDLERARLDAFLKDTYLPLTSRIGSSPVGFFNVSVGSQQPLLITLTSYASLAVMESALDQMAKDEQWNKALDEFDGGRTMTYNRIESRLLRAFKSMPAPRNPSAKAGPAAAFV